MSLMAVRAEIAKHYRKALPGVTVLEHGGPFDLEEIKRWVAKTPALVVTCLGVPKIEVQGGMAVADAAWAVFVMANSSPTETRDVTTARLAEGIASTLFGQRWAQLASTCPREMGASNLYGSALDKIGINLWVVKWRQSVDLLAVTTAELNDLLSVYTTYKPLDPADTSVVDMEGHVDLAGATP